MDEEKDDQNKKQDNQAGDEKTEKTAEEKLAECQKQAEEYLNNWKRERADFINYKKDETKRLEEFVKFVNEGLILEVIEMLDDLGIALKHDGGDSEGLRQIMKKFTDWLKKYDVEKIKINGEKFNPLLHEAIAAPSEALREGRETEKDGDSIEEIRPGYTMRGKVIRPTRVKLVK